jgi:DNA polymerase
MNEIQKQFLDIVTQVRTHLQLQQALGVNAIETISHRCSSSVPSVVPTNAQAVTKEPAARRPAATAVCSSLPALQQEVAGCTGCGLYQGRKKVVFGEGNPEAVLVFVGDAPGQEEDDEGRPFAGSAGRMLTDIIVKGMKLRREDVYICTVVKCAPPDNRKPEPEEIKACETVLIRQLEAIKPKIIVALGAAAAGALLKTREGITTLRGKWHNYHGIRVMPTFHPAHLLKKESDKRLVWEDIKKVMAEIEKISKGSR